MNAKEAAHKMKIVVEIEWDEPQDQNWLCPDNIAIALHAYCSNTKFKVSHAKNVIVARSTAKETAADIVHTWLAHGKTSVQLEAAITTALEQAYARGIEDSAQLLDRREIRLLECSGNTYLQRVECNVMARAIRALASQEGA